MAPAAKSKLSQTRIKTISPKVIANNNHPSPSSKAKAKQAKTNPNQSILSFFKKAPPAPDDALFITEAQPRQNSSAVTVTIDDVKEEDSEEGDDPEAAGRFNEAGGAVKRRKLSSDSSSKPSESESGVQGVETAGGLPSGRIRLVEAAESKRLKKPGNPFLDDDSDSDSDGSDDDGGDARDEHQPMAPAPSTTSVRPPPPVFDASREEHQRSEPAKLTSGERTAREIPLLRQQTSGVDSTGEETGAAQASAWPQDDVDLAEEDDFAGEELEAMRYMEEQARLEAAANGEEYEDNIDLEDGEAMTESCPVCNGSLAGATPDEATAHVNSCLDGNPTPLPKPPAPAVETEALALGKRFAKAAVPRPGQANPISLGDDAEKGPANSAFTKLMSGHAEDAAWATAAAAENASRGMPAYKRTCPFYKIMPGFSICVDAFRYGAVEGCQAYFLSHFHSDHYVGLTANWTHGPIYCSKVTGSLVKSQLRTAAKYVVELEFEKTVPVPDTKGVTVTMIPANHCPGSSLFLFEKTAGGRTQRILHCGDFRACPAHVKHPKLRPETIDSISGRTRQQKIDVCYLDTTYLNPRYSFPPQRDVIQACAELCALLNKGLLANDDSQWEALLRRRERGGNNTESVTKFFTTTATTSSSSTKPTPPPPLPPLDNAFTALNGRPHNPNRLLVVCGTYSIGKERICVAIAQALRSKIYASPAKIRMCRQLDDPELAALLTPDPHDAQVHMQMLMEIRAETLADYLAGLKPSFGRVVGFRPSGWNFRPSATSTSTSKTTTTTTTTTSPTPGIPTGPASASASANLPPTSLPTPHLLHSPAWRPRLRRADLLPQRGGSREALCFGVPYSEHSSFRELALFLLALRVERVVPTVNVGSAAARKRMKGWVEKWVGERRRGGVVRVLEEGEIGGGEGEGKREGKGEGKGEGGKKEVVLWDGKEGKGGAVFW